MVKIIILNERDIKIINEIQHWRFLLSRQIKVLGGFNGQRACDRRIKKLIEAGFGRCNKHFPDFTYTKDGHSCCVEIELSAKKLSTLEKNIKNNYVAYNSQRWYVMDNSKVQANITAVGKKYGVEIISLKGVTEFVRNL